MSDGLQPVPDARLTIKIDFDDDHWTHFVTAGGLVLTLQDLPHPLQQRIRTTIHGLQQRKIAELHFDSRRPDPALADQHPFDLRLLKEDGDFTEIFGLIDWWIKRHARQGNCRKDIYDKQQHPTWTCECGEKVSAVRELCTNEACVTWTKLTLCEGKKVVDAMRSGKKQKNIRLA